MGHFIAIGAATLTASLLIASSLPSAALARAEGLVVHPGDSIQAAVDAARPGDTVTVLPGTYHEAVCVTTDGIDLRGQGAVIVPPNEPPDTPCAVIPAGIFLAGQFDFATGVVTDPIGGVTVSGFRIEGFGGSGILLIGGEDVDIVENTAVDNEEYGIARFFSTGGTLRANRVTGSDEAGLYLGDSPNADATIVGNTAWDNGLFGIFVRDSSHGSVVGNSSTGNCVGLIVFSTHAPAENWTIKGNHIYDNTKACGGGDEGLPTSGIGIALAGASHTTVTGNVVTGNRATGPSVFTGGIVVASTVAIFGGSDPVDDLVKANVAHDNGPDLFYDGSGSGVEFVHNSCETSLPDGLC
jgi:parallel beta-helix repeat protein